MVTFKVKADLCEEPLKIIKNAIIVEFFQIYIVLILIPRESPLVSKEK